MVIRWLPFSGTVLALVMSGAVCADGLMRDGLGPRSTGRGGANIASADNGVVLYDNPAGIVNTEGCGLVDAGFDLLLTDMQYSDPENPHTDADDNPFPLGEFSIIRKMGGGRWAMGVGVFAPAGFGADYALEGPPVLPGPQHYKSIGALGKVLPGLAYQMTDRLSVGATLGVGIGHIEVEGPHILQSPGLFQGMPTLLDLQGTGAAPTWSLGLQYRLTEATTVGLTYQDETRLELDGTTRVDVPMLGQRSSFASKLDIAWPRSVGVGLRHAFNPRRIVMADVVWYDWSHAFNSFDLLLTDPTNPAFRAMLGPSIAEQFPLHWRDSVSVRLGYEHWLCPCHVLRCGYVYHRNPIPDGALTPYIEGILEHAVSAGYGCAGAWELDAAYQFSFGPDRTVDRSYFIGGDFDGSHHDVQAHWLSLGALRRF